MSVKHNILTNSPLTRKQESFCLEYFKTGNATQSAIAAGYKSKNADVVGPANLGKVGIKARLQQLKDAVDLKRGGSEQDKTIATVQERKQRLTEFLREDVVTKHGLNRQSNTTAADILNKMEHIYAPIVQINQDNRVLNIYVKDQETKELIEQAGGRSAKLLTQGDVVVEEGD